MTTADAIPGVAIGLVIQPPKNGIQEPQVLVGFQPSELLVQQLRGQRWRNPHFLVVVSSRRTYGYGDKDLYHEYEQTSATFVPFERLCTYVTFVRPGENRISVIVVDIDGRPANESAHRISTGKVTVLREDGTLDDDILPRSIELQEHRDVVVPADVFAPPPAPWMRFLVGQYFHGKGNDQCGFRRRLIASLVLAFFHQLAGLVVRPALLMWVVLGLYRDISYRNLLRFQLTTIKRLAGSSWWTTDSEGFDRGGAGRYLRFASPLALVGYAALLFGVPAIVFGIIQVGEHHGNSDRRYPLLPWGWWETVLKVDAALVWLIVLIGAGKLLSLLLSWLLGRLDRQCHKRWPSMDDRLWDGRVARLAAARLGENEELSWDTIPDESKTLTLRFAHLKTQVCRPFARS
jgi:hypothetical protein